MNISTQSGAYCAVVAARLTNVFTKEMFSGTGDWIAKYDIFFLFFFVFIYLYLYLQIFVCFQYLN